MDIKISPLPVDKWQEYKRIRLQALERVPDAFGSTYKREAEFPDEKWRERLDKCMKEENTLFLFAMDGEKAVGLLGAYWNGEDKPPGTVRLIGMYVDEAYQRQGIGKRLMSALLEKLSEYSFLKIAELEVYQQQTTAIALYTSMGFTIEKTNKFLKDGVEYDDYVMEKKLR